jgi:nitronate monooxygenase
MLTVLLEEKPAVVSCHFGLPHASQVSALREAGIVLVGSATSLAEEAGVAAAGFDAVVAQGVEAGGHRGGFDPSHPDDSLGTMALVRLLVRHGSLPVIAAGGIMDGAGIAAALALGAQAAQLGTAFVSCPESAADAAYRAALLDERALHTVVTSAISGRPARGIANRLTALGEAAGAPPHAGYPMTYDAGKALHAAAKAKGNVAFAAQWAGQAAALSRPMGAAQLVATLMRETDEALAELHARLAALPGHRLNPQP